MDYSEHQGKHDHQFMHLEDQDPMESHSNKIKGDKFKRKREILARNTLISLYSLGGFIGVASLTALIVSRTLVVCVQYWQGWLQKFILEGVNLKFILYT